ncbi:MAG: superoxide dismutase [Komarekiella atlantica HA4396-MV6]|jgi:Fe-Mn family superoxide dismutase|nr:superoxide dismutase [Komarekiella atlantica HA4396-MV6]
MAFELPPLPYNYNALEPYIDTETMRLHHDKHHQAYVTNVNAALEKHPELNSKSIEDLVIGLNSLPQDIMTTMRNNGGGHINHTMFWQIMKPNGGGEPIGAIADVINDNFGDFETFKQRFNDAGAKQFGSGWVWLVRTPDSKFEVTSTPNQDSPKTSGSFPIMGNDVWEHAYYLKYQNRRPEYLKQWWNVVNWDEINKRLQMSTQ